MALQTLYSVSAVLKILQNPLTSSLNKVNKHFGIGERRASEMKISKSVENRSG